MSYDLTKAMRSTWQNCSVLPWRFSLFLCFIGWKVEWVLHQTKVNHRSWDYFWPSKSEQTVFATPVQPSSISPVTWVTAEHLLGDVLWWDCQNKSKRGKLILRGEQYVPTCDLVSQWRGCQGVCDPGDWLWGEPAQRTVPLAVIS